MAASQSLLILLLMMMMTSSFLGVVRGADNQTYPRPQIVGGVSTTIEDAPWQVAVHISNTFCGGSIISNTWVLTAAHCTFGSTASSIRLRVGTATHNQGGQVYSVSRVVVHEQYNSESTLNDISAMRTSSAMDLNGVTTRAVGLPFQGAERPPAGTTLTVTGWGLTETGSQPSTLRAVDVQIQDFGMECGVFAITDPSRQICAFASNRGSCQGDSGGPLVLDQILRGIVSFGRGGEPCAQHASVYTDVAAYRDWITEETGV